MVQCFFPMIKKIVLILIAIGCAGVVFLLLRTNEFYRKIYVAQTVKTTPVPEKTSYSILLMGYGGGTHEGTYLTDSMMIVKFDTKSKRAVLISVPRDIWIKIPNQKEDVHRKINELYSIELFPKTFPGIILPKNNRLGDLTKKAVSQITGEPIDYFIAVDFSGFKKAIDILGGITVNVDRAFDDVQYPITGMEKDLCGKTEEDLPELEKIATDSPELAFPCRYERLHFDAGKTFMNGETALKYVRSRHSGVDGGDFNRGRRQQLFLMAVKDKVLSLNLIPKILPLLDELQGDIKTDLDMAKMQIFLKEAATSGNYTLANVVFSDKDTLRSNYALNGQYILIPRDGIDQWGPIQTLIKNTLLGITPTPTPTKTTIRQD